MKEATGELNTAVIVMIIVALLSFLFFSVFWPNIHASFAKNTKCNEAVCKCLNWNGSVCEEHECFYIDKSGRKKYITCTWKG